MSDENHSLEYLQQKAEFLRKEKQRIIKAKREQEAIKKLQLEIEDLQTTKPDIRAREELINLGKKSIKDGIGVLKQASKSLLDGSKKSEKTQIEKDLEEAQISGLWPNEETLPSQDTLTHDPTKLEQKWEEEKLRIKKENTIKAQKAAIAAKKSEQQTNEGCLVAVGALAWFIPILWPVVIIQLFKTYPTTCFTLLGAFVFIIIIASASFS